MASRGLGGFLRPGEIRQTQRMQGVEIWNKVNESAEVIVWPGVVTFALILFRARLGELFKRLREAATPAGTMRFDPDGSGTADVELAVSASTLVENVMAASQLSESAESDEADRQAALDMREIKEDVEQVIRAAFAAGFGASRYSVTHGLKEGRSPRPSIVWEGSIPKVTGFAVDGRETLVGDSRIVDYFVAQARERSASERIDLLRKRIEELEDLMEEARDDDVLRTTYASQLVAARRERDEEKTLLAEIREQTRALKVELDARPGR
jgi:hypothetical protein